MEKEIHLEENELTDTCRFLVINEISVQLNNWVRSQPKISGVSNPYQLGKILHDVTDRELWVILNTVDDKTFDKLWFGVSQLSFMTQGEENLIQSDRVQAYNQVYSNLLKLEGLVDITDKEHVTSALANLSLMNTKLTQ